MNINVNIAPTPKELGQRAAESIAKLLNQAITERGVARIILSTGASQFDTIKALLTMEVDWSCVEVFHLDEYVNLPKTHAASFRKYLDERFVSKVTLKKMHYVDGEGDVQANIKQLTAELKKAPIDVGVIGIGENGHIAFNDPPADFASDEAYKIVKLDNKCKMQQVGEGWFPSIDDVPTQAITMLPKQIMACRHIVSSSPHAVKSWAIFHTIINVVNNNLPATLLKNHPSWQLFLDRNSASMLFNYN